MQHTDKAIAEFEVWWGRQPHREQFKSMKTQMRNVWVASRAELVIDLPEEFDSGYTRPEMAMISQEVREAIEAAGVTVRG